MVKGLRMREFNQQLHNSFAKLRPFPGASIKQLEYYAVLTLTLRAAWGGTSTPLGQLFLITLEILMAWE